MKFSTDPNLARQLDADDPLSQFRSQFYIPQTTKGQNKIYLCGNSLGLSPIAAAAAIQETLTSWQTRGVDGHLEGEFPWLPYHSFLTEDLAAMVGGDPSEVVAMNSLSANLHLMLVSFYNPKGRRTKILIERRAFPSDFFAVQSQLVYHGFDPKQHLVFWEPESGSELYDVDTLSALLNEQGDSIALAVLPGVSYYSGQAFDIAAITRLLQSHGIVAGWDLAHAFANLELELPTWNVDFAVWCHYKYANGGPGAIGGAFVHRRHLGHDLPRFHGWWGHREQDRFKMALEFHPFKTAEAWQLSNPPIFAAAAVRASLSVFREAGYMGPLATKSRLLTHYLAYLLQTELADSVQILSPLGEGQHGCQLSLVLKNEEPRRIYQVLSEHNVVVDFREPNVIRCAPVPLYNSFSDAYSFVQILKEALV